MATFQTIAWWASRACVAKLGDTIKIGRRGSLSFIVTVDGIQGHVAYPQNTDNPIPKLSRLLDRISYAKIDDGNDHFDPSSLAVTTVDVGNTAGNVVPARATAKFNIRYSTEHDYQSLREWVDAHVASVREELGGTWSVTSNEGAEAFITEPGAFVGLVQDAVEQETGLVPKLSTSGGTSDARFIKNYCPVLEFGPTNATSHKVDENISVEGTARHANHLWPHHRRLFSIINPDEIKPFRRRNYATGRAVFRVERCLQVFRSPFAFTHQLQ